MRILHLSDLHMGTERRDWRRRKVLGAAWDANLEQILEDGPIDFVCFTGDVADAGRDEEYAQATEFLAHTLRVLGVATEDLFVVPGNHDVDWAASPDEYACVRAHVRHERDVALSRYLAGLDSHSPRGIAAATLDRLHKRQAAYGRWLSELGLSHLESEWRFDFRVGRTASCGTAVTFIGLNSAWLSGPDDHHKLLVTEDDVQRLLEDGDDDEPSLRIALMHHPFGDLVDGRSVQDQLAGRIDVLLRGHLHRTESSHYLIDQGRGFAELAVGSLFDSQALDRYPNGCQVVTIDPGEPLLSGSNWFRSWSGSGGFWHSDNSLYAKSRDGRLGWLLAPRQTQATHLPANAAALTPHRYADYLRALRNQASQDGVATGLMRPDRIYVPQRVRPVLEGDGEDDCPPHEHDLLELMDEFWSGGRSRVLIFGNYGMGKTYFALRTVIEQTGAFIEPSAPRVPVYFPLHRLDCHAASLPDGEDRRDIIDQILVHLGDLDFPVATRHELERLLASGAVGIVLDGLDELKTRASEWKELLAPLLAIKGAYCCVTSRTADVGDTNELLADWDVFELQEWRPDNEWPAYVRKCTTADNSELLDAVKAKPRLRSLTTRPLWCFMIVDVRERVCAAEHDIDEAQLYQYFLDRALAQVMRQRRLMQTLTVQQKFVSLERFARRCATENRTSLDSATVSALLEQYLKDLDMLGLVEFLERELSVYSFLNVDRYRRFSFGHESFGSYFTAAAAVRELVAIMVGAAARDVRDTWLAHRELDPDQLVFSVGILLSSDTMATLGILPAGAAGERLLASLEEFVRGWLQRTRVPAPLRRNLTLQYALVAQRMGNGDGRPPANVLRDFVLRGAALMGADFSDLELRDIDFRRARLQGASFRGSRLTDCCFERAIVDGADFAHSTLRGCSFEHTDVSAADFTDASGAPDG